MPEIGRSGDGAGADDRPPFVAVTLAEMALERAWNVRGDPAHAAFVSQAQRLFGLPLPLRPNTSVADDAITLLWLGPTSWLLVDGRDGVSLTFDAARSALNGVHGALFDLSASYVAWRVAGEAAARVLARGCPLDLHPRAFPPGRCAQSLLGHVVALLHRPDEQPAFTVMVARSFAADAFQLLRESAETEGARVAAIR